jgi:hypothetical protein
MVDWATLLRPDRLELPDPTIVHSIKVLERVDRHGDTIVEVWVIISPRICEADVTWELVAPIQRAISGRIIDQPDAGYPYVRFFTHDDWLSIERGDDDEEAQDAAA